MATLGFRYYFSCTPLYEQIQSDKLIFNETTGEVFKDSILIYDRNQPKSNLDAVSLLHDVEYHYATAQDIISHFKFIDDARL